MKKLALHICCGPCAMYPVNLLLNDYPEYDITGIFFNPNIHPHEEFDRRKANVEIMAKHFGIPVVFFDDYREDEWHKYGGPINPDRCKMCYDTRIAFTAEYAAKNGFDSFSSTLLVSPYQNHQYIIDKSTQIADVTGLNFMYIDFRTGFREGQRAAKELGLYRQKYCGCCWSLPPEKNN